MEEEEAAAEILQLHELHHSDLILLSSSNPTSNNASSSFDEDLLRKTSSVMEALGPMGPGLLAVTGVPNASELRSELLRLAPKLALLHRDTRKRVLKPFMCNRMVRFIKTHGRPSSITGLFNNRYYGVKWASNFELESLQEHNLGSDVPLRNPDRSVSSFAMNLKYAKAPGALTTTDQLHSEAYPQDVEEASAECNDMEFKNLGSTFKELGLCMMEVGLCLARICDKAIGSNELEQSLLESCAAKGRLIHYHSRLDSFLLKEVEKTGAAGKRKAKNNKRDPGSCVMNVQKSLQGSSESNSIARDDHNSCGIHSNLWQQWHYDYGIFTVLTAPFFLWASYSDPAKTEHVFTDSCFDECPSPTGHSCLQIYDPNKKRIFMVKAPPDSFIIQVGESADIISKGKLRATLHAVHRPVKFNNLSRETFVVFLQPAWTKTLSTADYSHAKLMKEYNDDEQVGEDRYKQLSCEFQKIVPPLSSRLKDGMTFAEFSRETTKQYYGGSGLQSNK
ncbi:uncharacterized protein LOC130961013 isoform X1 [Arachis stenosperma]|uniref:uncharacterized protein LOC130961013 isoform X1 n=1 Tax=Arachis stenosperma TaxID=217475 RepID=UPI0025ACA824|nr:uncharacterized protein LOC130961013 isoform X1 [Arachis stenosperma]